MVFANVQKETLLTTSPARVPTGGDVVAVNPGATVTYDAVSDAPLKAVAIHPTEKLVSGMVTVVPSNRYTRPFHSQPGSALASRARPTARATAEKNVSGSRRRA